MSGAEEEIYLLKEEETHLATEIQLVI